MKNFQRFLLDFYSNTINTIDINTEKVIFKNKDIETKLNNTRSKMIELVVEIQNVNVKELRNKKEISIFCFFIPFENRFGNLVILNQYLNEKSLKSIFDRKFSPYYFKENIIFELINRSLESTVIDLSQSDRNYLEQLTLDGFAYSQVIDGQLIEILQSIINVQGLKKIKFENAILIFNDNFMHKLSGLNSITIRWSKITGLHSIESLSNLNTIDLCFNKLKRIELKNLSNLETVKLNGNEIEELDSSFFQDLFNLKILELKQNSIKRIKLETFKYLPSLVKLDLSNNGRLLIEENFSNLYNLKYLNLSGNSMKQLFIGTKSLEYLEAGEFKEINLECNLKFLGLKCNKPHKLSYLSDVQFLYIEGLKSIEKNDFESFKSIKFVSLSFDIDPFICGIEKNIPFDSPKIKCFQMEFPYSYKLNRTYNLECSGEVKQWIENGNNMKIIINKVFYLFDKF